MDKERKFLSDSKCLTQAKPKHPSEEAIHPFQGSEEIGLRSSLVVAGGEMKVGEVDNSHLVFSLAAQPAIDCF